MVSLIADAFRNRFNAEFIEDYPVESALRIRLTGPITPTSMCLSLQFSALIALEKEICYNWHVQSNQNNSLGL